MKKILALFSLVLLTAVFASAISITPIDATLKAVDANGLAINTTSAYTIIGVNVTPFNMDGTATTRRFQRYIVDTATGWGMMIDKASANGANPNYNFGDLMQVTGSITFYNGLIEFTPTDTTINLGSGYAVSTALLSSIAVCTSFDATLATGGEYYESRLVRLNNVWKSSGTWPAAGSDANIVITDNSGATITMRIDKDTDVDGSAEPSGHFNVVGVVTQYDANSPYDSGYQIIPTKVEDVTAVTDWAVMAK
jgi:hypothetical protein